MKLPNIKLRYVFATLLLCSASTFVAQNANAQEQVGQDAPFSEGDAADNSVSSDYSTYQSPAFIEEAPPSQLPVRGNSDLVFNPKTGLYEHRPQENVEINATAGDAVTYKGSVATPDDIDPFLDEAGMDENDNSRGIRNIGRSSSGDPRGNVEAYRKMMGEQDDKYDDPELSKDDRVVNRSYLKSNRSSSSRASNSRSGIFSNRIDREEYSEDDDSYYDDERGNRYNSRYSNGRDGRDGRNGRSRDYDEPKTGNRDAYQEMMSTIE